MLITYNFVFLFIPNVWFDKSNKFYLSVILFMFIYVEKLEKIPVFSMKKIVR